MPTFAHVVAAILYAALAWYVSHFMIEPLFPEAFDPGLFSEFNALVGLVCGWTIMGSRATLGFVPSISIGFTAILMTVFWSMFLHSWGEMLRRSLDRAYDGPVEAVAEVFELMVDYLFLMSTVPVWTTLIVGGIVAGIVTGIFGKIWR